MTNVLNTLYVTTPKAYVAIEGECLRVRVEHETRLEIPMHHLASLVCLGPVGVSPPAMHACAVAGVAVVFLDERGRFLARVEGPLGVSSTLRRAQLRTAEDPARAVGPARSFVVGKLVNARLQLRRAARTREATERLGRAADRLAVLAEHASAEADLDVLRGYEGEGASRYFEVFDDMVESPDFPFERRTRRPPRNELNALLSFGYSLLSTDCLAAVQSAGLDPGVGFLHAERPGRPALALDLMEELRPIVVDRLVLALIHLRQVGVDGFERLPTGEVRMTDPTRKTYLVEYQARKRDEVTHPLTEQRIPWGLVPHVQARLLARTLRGEGEYVPFMPK